jgi:hypothetical protein
VPRRPMTDSRTALLVGHFQTLGVAAPDRTIVGLVDEATAALVCPPAGRGRRDRPWSTNLHLSTQA